MSRTLAIDRGSHPQPVKLCFWEMDTYGPVSFSTIYRASENKWKISDALIHSCLTKRLT